MTTIGLYVYQITMHDSGTHKQVDMGANGVGKTFSDCLPHFLKSASSLTQNQATSRSWAIEQKRTSANIFDGIIKYGTYGHTSEIIDPNAGQSLFNRADHHVEQIPLYYQYFVDPGKAYAMCAFQSFKTWSCVSVVNADLNSAFRNFSGDSMYLKFHKVMPSEIASYGNSEVKRLTLVKHRVKRDKFDVLNGINVDEVNVEMDFSVRRRGKLGKLKDIADQLDKNSANNVIKQSGLDFERVTATVRVGTTYKKVGVLGPAVNAGVIDVSDDVAGC
ncbi:MAG: hypothetical protein EP318_17195 [Rhodobacteraceae bacterium]|nr:MAG: hypothetical protein EP318_17195 [Paracoccaceae bacterium]